MPSEIRGSDNFDSDSVGKVLQVVNYRTGAAATGTTIIPRDASIPQQTEGNQYMSLAITPKSATSFLLVNANIGSIYNTAAESLTMALFRDTTANALAVSSLYTVTNNGHETLSLSHYTASGSTSTTTFKVRAGGHQTGTTYINSPFGGVVDTSITITEIEA